MPKKGHTEEQITGALKQYENGEKVAEICRKLGVSPGVVLYLEEVVCRDGCSGVARAAATAGLEQPVEAAGCGSEPGAGRSYRRLSQKSSKGSPTMPDS